MSIFSRIAARKMRIGGNQHSGWLPEGAATLLPTPVREVTMTFEITDDGGGNFLLVCYSEDKSVHCDTWHQSIEEAKEAARISFDVSRSEWKDEA